MALTKRHLVEKICDGTGLTKKEALSIVESLFETVKEELSSGRPVMISGFGKFTVKSKKARVGRNPKTGQKMEISARNVVTFKGSNRVKDVVNADEP